MEGIFLGVGTPLFVDLVSKPGYVDEKTGNAMENAVGDPYRCSRR